MDKHRIIFAGLDDNDSTSLNKEDLHKFLREILKEQIKELQSSLAEKSPAGQDILRELKIIEEQIKSVD